MIKLTKKHIPNILLIIRMLLACVIFALFISIYYHDVSKPVYTIWYGHWSFTPLFLSVGILFIIASFTDWLDGYLARKYKWVSNFGKIWDPIADKILINITLIGLAILNYIPWWLFTIMIVRDIIVDASRIYAAHKKRVIAADIYGKLKTIFQILGITVILFLFNESSFSIYYLTQSATRVYYWTIQNGLLIIATLFSLGSGANYLYKIYKPSKLK